MKTYEEKQEEFQEKLVHLCSQFGVSLVGSYFVSDLERGGVYGVRTTPPEPLLKASVWKTLTEKAEEMALNTRIQIIKEIEKHGKQD